MQIFAVVLWAAILTLTGCAGSDKNQDPPPVILLNVYQPATSSIESCPVIEYRWEGEAGPETATHTGVGDFCILLNVKEGPLEARCVDSEGAEVVPWISAKISRDLSEFKMYCPGAEAP